MYMLRCDDGRCVIGIWGVGEGEVVDPALVGTP